MLYLFRQLWSPPLWKIYYVTAEVYHDHSGHDNVGLLYNAIIFYLLLNGGGKLEFGGAYSLFMLVYFD